MTTHLVRGDARHIPLAANTVQCVVTSPPYWGLRKYAGEQELVWGGREDCEHAWQTSNVELQKGTVSKKQLTNRGNTGVGFIACYGTCFSCGAWRGAYGLEPTVEMYVQHTVEILREIRRVLRDDGVVFWNIGDSYAGSWGDSGHRPERSGVAGYQRPKQTKFFKRDGHPRDPRPVTVNPGAGLKPKDLCLIPFRVALAAQADGWWVRSDIIWAKPNPMPESVRDRPTRSHEYILMLTKSAKYYWDAEAVAEPLKCPDEGKRKTPARFGGANKFVETKKQSRLHSGNEYKGTPSGKRNIRSIWTFPTRPYKGAHFAVFPPELPRRCIKAATREGDLVLDPFSGSGTVGVVATELGRRSVLLDLAYQSLAQQRLQGGK